MDIIEVLARFSVYHKWINYVKNCSSLQPAAGNLRNVRYLNHFIVGRSLAPHQDLSTRLVDELKSCRSGRVATGNALARAFS
jgi:hypothetical protein